MSDIGSAGAALERLANIMRKLRAPDDLNVGFLQHLGRRQGLQGDPFDRRVRVIVFDDESASAGRCGGR